MKRAAAVRRKIDSCVRLLSLLPLSLKSPYRSQIAYQLGQLFKWEIIMIYRRGILYTKAFIISVLYITSHIAMVIGIVLKEVYLFIVRIFIGD